LFLAEEGLTPSRVDRCDVTASTIECVDAEDGADWGVYELCGNLWLSADGARIYTACGVTLSVPQDVSVDACAYGGALDGVDAIQHMSEAPEVQRVVLIPGFASKDGPSDDSTPPGDMVIRVHETQYLGFVAQYELPPFPLPGGGVSIAHGRFVFTTPSMDTFYTIVQADPSSASPNAFAIVTMTP
jgi:hypothetical protein